jgi:bifunctional lysine-specific demethylase and histidyl-hydroxylase MINA
LTTFADLLQPMTSETFFREHHGRMPVHIRGPANKFASVLSRGDVSELLASAASWPARLLRIVVDTQTVDPQEYCHPGRDREGRTAMMVDPERVRDWIALGATVMLAAVDSLVPGLRAVTGAIEQATGGDADTNLYLSLRGRQGFGSHFDRHDVYVLQTYGEKEWQIYQSHFDAPVEHPLFSDLGQTFHETHKGEVSHAVTLTPGDLLYIPRGWYHDAVASSRISLHLTIGVNEPVGLDLVKILYDRAVQDVLFRRAVPRPCNSDALDRHMEDLGARLAEYARMPEIREQFRASLHGYNRPRVVGDILTDILPDDPPLS